MIRFGRNMSHTFTDLQAFVKEQHFRYCIFRIQTPLNPPLVRGDFLILNPSLVRGDFLTLTRRLNVS